MAFFRYWQNNSFGQMNYDYDKGIGVTTYIEANSAHEANTIAESIGMYFDGVEKDIDCRCCGDRFDRAEHYHAKDTLSVESPIHGPVYIHYLNGEVKLEIL